MVVSLNSTRVCCVEYLRNVLGHILFLCSEKAGLALSVLGLTAFRLCGWFSHTHSLRSFTVLSGLKRKCERTRWLYELAAPAFMSVSLDFPHLQCFLEGFLSVTQYHFREIWRHSYLINQWWNSCITCCCSVFMCFNYFYLFLSFCCSSQLAYQVLQLQQKIEIKDAVLEEQHAR